MDTKAAFDLLWSAWQSRADLDGLPQKLCPQNETEAYAIQAHFEAVTSKPLYGWKIAATSLAGQQHINVPGPIAGRLIAEHAYADGADVPFGHELLAVMEPEFAFCIGREIAPRGAPYTQDEVLADVASLHPAIELPNTRFRDITSVGAHQIAAEAACAGTFVLGPAAPNGWRDLDLSKHPVTVRINEGELLEGIGANVLDDPRAALVWLVNKVTSLGQTLAAGQVITTGTCMPPPPMSGGDRAVADFGALGRVSMRFSKG